jgi:hypothetical protein
MPSRRTAWLLWATLGASPLVAQRVTGQESPRPSHDTLSRICKLARPLRFVGTANTPLFSVGGPAARGNRVYFPDFIGNRVLVFTRDGHLLHLIGASGSQVGQFVMPYGVLTDGLGRIYVNDRGNQRVQVLDSNAKVLKVVSTPGENEQLLLLQRPGHPDPLLLSEGITRCSGNQKRCLFAWHDLDGRFLGAFAEAPADVGIASWVAAVDENGNVYLANVLGWQMTIYDSRGELRGGFSLKSNSMRVFSGLRAAHSPEELAVQQKDLRTQHYTQFASISLTPRHVIVTLQRVNPVPAESEYVLDVYDRSGIIQYEGVHAPGVLRPFGASLAFVRSVTSSYGTVVIQPCTGVATQ